MKRVRLIVVAALATASIGFAAAPASACQPDGPPCCYDNAADRLWLKLTGEHLFSCPW
jgi:hypothetical protein